VRRLLSSHFAPNRILRRGAGPSSQRNDPPRRDRSAKRIAYLAPPEPAGGDAGCPGGGVSRCGTGCAGRCGTGCAGRCGTGCVSRCGIGCAGPAGLPGLRAGGPGGNPLTTDPDTFPVRWQPCLRASGPRGEGRSRPWSRRWSRPWSRRWSRPQSRRWSRRTAGGRWRLRRSPAVWQGWRRRRHLLWGRPRRL
jgi:hypothetical protein